MNRRLMLAGAAALAAGAGASLAWWRSQRGEADSQAVQSFWSQRFDRPEGGELAMTPFRGKPLLLNFWATWCAPCVREMPMIDAFESEHRARGWQVVGLAVDSPTPVREFLTKLKVGFPIGLAGLNGVDLGRSLGNERGGLPFTVVFDRAGKIAGRKLGALKPDDLQNWVKTIG